MIKEIYDNQRWNVAVSVRPDKYGLVGNVVSTSDPTYTLEFYGVTHAFDTVKDEFLITAPWTMQEVLIFSLMLRDFM